MENILLNVLEVSLGASVVILLMTLAAPLAGKKFSAKWRYWVWMLLAIRLLLPVELSLNLPQPRVSIPVPPQLMVEQDFVPKAQEETGALVGAPAVPTLPESGIIVETQPIAPEIEGETRWTPNGLELLFVVWVAGVVGSVVWQLVAYLRWQNEGKVWNRMVEDGAVLNLYYELCAEQGISKFPQLMTNKRIQSPMMMGLLEPAILLPQMEYSEEDYAVVLTHELNHYKRHDLWYKLLLLAARCVHWFNPLVWLMLREADNDLEITCDEAVVKNRSSDDRAFYCETILRIMCRGKGRYAVLSTGFNGGKKVLQRRFEAVLNDRASKGFVLGAVSMALLVFFSSFVSCDVKEQEKPADVPVVNEEEEIKYKAIPERQRYVAENIPEEVRTRIDTDCYLRTDFWEGKARSFFLAEFELSEELPSKEFGKFFNMVAGDQQFYYAGGWKINSNYQTCAVPGNDIWAVVRSHLPDSTVLNCELTEAFNESGETDGPYYAAVDVYHFEGKTPSYPSKATEVISSVKEGDIITVELAAYDMDKYYADPQVKEVIETYRFSVRVAKDSWFLLEADLTEMKTPTAEVESEPAVPSTPTVTQPVIVPAEYCGEPFTKAFRGLDIHATEQYETLNFYTTDGNAISTVLTALNWQGKQPVAPKQELVTHDIDLSGHYVRLITNNMEQLYLYKDHDQALYRDKAGKSSYYDVDDGLYERIFGLVEEVHSWKLNPVTDSRAEPFDENYTTLDIYAQELENQAYCLTIRTFCEMLIDDLNWEEIAVRDEAVSDYLDPIGYNDGDYLRISTNTGRHLYIYKDYPYGVYYTGHGNEHYYKLPSGTYDRVLNLLKTYSFYKDADAPLDVFPFQRDFTQITVSLYKNGNVNSNKVTLDVQDSYRMMAGIPTGYFKQAERKEELTLDKGDFVLIENFDGQKLAIYNGKSQAKHWTADGKVAYYELGADYYDIAKAVANRLAGLINPTTAVGDISLTSRFEYWQVGEVVECVLKNNTDRNINGGDAYILEKEVNGVWTEVKAQSGKKFNTDTGVIHDAHSEETLRFDLEQKYGTLEAGRYRIVLTETEGRPAAEFELKPFNPPTGMDTGRNQGKYSIAIMENGNDGDPMPLNEEHQKEFIDDIFSELKKTNRKSTVTEPFVSVSILENGKQKTYQVSKSNYDSQRNVQLIAVSASDYLYEAKGNLFEELVVFINNQLNPEANPETAKPVIYLYPEETMDVSIKLDYNGQLTTTYPAYNNGWTVTAQPDGTISSGGREYYCLFWEGNSAVDYDLSSGFVVKGNETEAFLEKSLQQLGLTDKEANEFIIYWLPKMENNPYNLISFQQEVYTDNAVLTIEPKPDSLLRVFMAWKGLNVPVSVPVQQLPSFERSGFTVVEWGGSEM